MEQTTTFMPKTSLCEPNPCKTSGKCTDSGTNDYQCICLPDFTGKDCGIKMDSCLSVPCANNATCSADLLRWTCQCSHHYEGEQCEQKIDPCESDPCLHRGTCIQVDDGTKLGYQCNCLKAFDGGHCEHPLTSCAIQSPEEKAERIIMMAAQSLSSTAVIVSMVILLIIFLILLDFSQQRLLHMGQEITLLIAQCIIVVARTPSVMDLEAFCGENAEANPERFSPDICKTVAVCLHFLFLSHFAFLFLEALNNYAIWSYITNGEPLLGFGKCLVLAVFCPILIVCGTVLFYSNGYITPNTCWVNCNAINFKIELVPIVLLCVAAMVMFESTGKLVLQLVDIF